MPGTSTTRVHSRGTSAAARTRKRQAKTTRSRGTKRKEPAPDNIAASARCAIAQPFGGQRRGTESRVSLFFSRLLALPQSLLLHPSLLLQFSDFLSLGIQAHLHEEHLALLGNELCHALFLLLPIIRDHCGRLFRLTPTPHHTAPHRPNVCKKEGLCECDT